MVIPNAPRDRLGLSGGGLAIRKRNGTIEIALPPLTDEIVRTTLEQARR